MGRLYKITYRVSGKAYIGQTIQPILDRMKQHQRPSSGCKAILGAIQKHGWENFDVEWHEVPDDELNLYEEMLVALLGTLAPGGYNLREGGGSHGKMSDVSKQKMSDAWTDDRRQEQSEAMTGENNPMSGRTGENNPFYGKTHLPETKQKLSEANIGKTHSPETKQKISEAMKGEKNPNYGKTPSFETKQKMSEAKKGEKHPNYGKTLAPDTKKKISESKKGEKNPFYGKTGVEHPISKTVYRYNLDGTYVDDFGSSEEAARVLGKNCGSKISACARGDRKTAFGFRWSREKMDRLPE